MFWTARSTANVTGRSGGSSKLTRRQGEPLNAVRGLNRSSDSEKREIVPRTSPSPTASSAFERDVLARGERQARRAAERGVEVRSPELIVGDEGVAGGGRGLRLRRHACPCLLQPRVDIISSRTWSLTPPERRMASRSTSPPSVIAQFLQAFAADAEAVLQRLVGPGHEPIGEMNM